MCSSNEFKFRAVRFVMLVLNFSGKWRVEKERVSSFVCKRRFSAVSLVVLQSQFISIDSLRLVIGLSEQISSEDLGSKS
jgi:hypothetical protein